MAATYFVKKIEQCAKCEGKKLVQHPAWTEYWQANQDKQPMSLEEDRKWFEEHGWINAPGYRYEMDTDGLPDEDIVCSDCEGQGEIESEVDLLEVLPEILDSIKSKAM